jgi:hypothetical protein
MAIKIPQFAVGYHYNYRLPYERCFMNLFDIDWLWLWHKDCFLRKLVEGGCEADEKKIIFYGTDFGIGPLLRAGLGRYDGG